MAQIGGSWECGVETPVGPRRFVAEITSSGERFEALVKGNFGELQITDGKLDGDVMTWSMTIKTPLSMKLDCTATVNGDQLNGSVSAGVFGKYPLTGTRI
ncbi:MAG: hypothetical protein JOZ90_15075 [Alphaproteobacteria bacterium]|nr:hypothetical protein [Alphaproteobacteria bacterium]MBV9371459.1 hypothetical protein [Alphaproteobacteria bacterium]MBV9902396.1 hypothetical protein [Alphaproteobacteria bacterium]